MIQKLVLDDLESIEPTPKFDARRLLSNESASSSFPTQLPLAESPLYLHPIAFTSIPKTSLAEVLPETEEEEYARLEGGVLGGSARHKRDYPYSRRDPPPRYPVVVTLQEQGSLVQYPNGHAIPSDGQTVPSDEQAMPSDGQAMPSDGQVIPSDSDTHYALPKDPLQVKGSKLNCVQSGYTLNSIVEHAVSASTAVQSDV